MSIRVIDRIAGEQQKTRGNRGGGAKRGSRHMAGDAMSVPAAAEQLRVPLRVLERAIKAGDVRTIKFGARFITAGELARLNALLRGEGVET